MNMYYRMIKMIFRIFHCVSSQSCRVSGESNARSAAKIIAANHTNVTDGLFLPFVFQENLHFFIQAYASDIPVMGWLFKKSGQIPVDPGHKNQSLDQAAKLLDQGKTVVIFPEGRLNPDNHFLKARTRAVRLSLMTNSPIIPVGFYVPQRHLHNICLCKNDHLSGGYWQLGGHCYLQIGKPWLPGEEIHGAINTNKLHELTDRLMEKINNQVYMARQICYQETGLLSKGVSHYGW